MLRSPVRSTALLGLATLVAVTLPLVTSSPVRAANPLCPSEAPIGPVQCDDDIPPETTSAAPLITGSGAVQVVSSAAYAGNDPLDSGPIGRQCSLDGAAFVTCPAQYDGLPTGTHTIAVRAVDVHDNAVVIAGEVPDHDQTPEVLSFATGGGGTSPSPSGAPETRITGGPVDRITPGTPVTLSRKVTVTIASSEPAAFNCAVNAKKVPCQPGVNVLKKLRPGPQVFVAQAVDRDGNFDASPASTTFYVPTNLTPSQGHRWSKVKHKGSYAGGYVSTRVRGAVLTLRGVKRIHELRLFAPTGPRLGKVAVRVGRGQWHKVNLTSSKAEKLKVFEILPPGSPAASGPIQIRAAKIPRGGQVAVDAVVAR